MQWSQCVGFADQSLSRVCWCSLEAVWTTCLCDVCVRDEGLAVKEAMRAVVSLKPCILSVPASITTAWTWACT